MCLGMLRIYNSLALPGMIGSVQYHAKQGPTRRQAVVLLTQVVVIDDVADYLMPCVALRRHGARDLFRSLMPGSLEAPRCRPTPGARAAVVTILQQFTLGETRLQG
jgi:hypothetical protein